MKLRLVPVFIAAFFVTIVGITPAWSYFPSDFAVNSQSSQVSSTSSSTSSSSSSRSSASSSKTSVSSKSKSSVSAAVQCYLDAVDKRETKVIDSFKNYTSFMAKILTMREELLLKYWSNADTKKRDQDIRTVWRTFGQAWRKNGLAVRKERRIAWEIYRADITACGIYPQYDPDASGLSADAQF
jgi:hypothetical protein